MHPKYVLAAMWLCTAVCCTPSPFPEVDVFSIGEAGYFCIKIPYLLSTSRGTLIALAEARYFSCSDFTATDLVFKRSTDSGQTWSTLGVLYSNSSIPQREYAVIGNAAPVQLQTGRILVPFCRNNLMVLQTYSDDDGRTWARPVSIPQATRSYWRWIGTGPPGSIQLASGRIVTPSYHSAAPHNTDGTFTRLHLLLNDDPNGDPTQWRIGAIAPSHFMWTNECQAVELESNHLLVASRGFLTRRIQVESVDGGETLNEPYYTTLSEPLGGCEGSIVHHVSIGLLLYSGSINPQPQRYNMTVDLGGQRCNMAATCGCEHGKDSVLIPSGAAAILRACGSQREVCWLAL